MRVVIAGTRYVDSINKVPFDDYALIVDTIKASGYNITEVVSGTAIGVDRLGERWAVANNIPVKEMPADWYQYGKRAGPIRNRNMAEYADAAIIIWDGVSNGTKNMINEMKRVNKPFYVGFTYLTVEDFVEETP